MSRPIVVLLALAAASLLGGRAIAQDKPLRIIISSDLRKVYYANADLAAEKPADAFEKAVKDQQAADPDAFFLDAGYSLAPISQMETGYGYPSHKALRTLNADAINLTATDTFYAAGRQWGVASITDEKEKGRYVARLGFKGVDNSFFMARAASEVSRGPRKLRIVSLSDPDRVSIWPDLRTRFVFDENAALKAMRPTGDANTFTIALGEMDPAVLTRIAAGNDRPDLIVSLTGKRDASIRGGGNTTPIVQLPPPGSLLLIEANNDGSIVPKAIPFADADKVAKGWTAPVPDLGIGIGNAAESLPEKLGAAKDKIEMAVFERDDLKHLSARKRIRGYNIEVAGKPHRAWRLTTAIVYNTPDGGAYEAGGWSRLDMLVMLDDKHVLRKVVTKTPVAYMDFMFDPSPFFETLYGKDPKEWYVDAPRYPGGEELLEWILADLRRVVELDRTLYPDKPAT